MSTEKVIKEIESERLRQMQQEGWTRAHDDEYDTGQLCEAAACYALHCNDGAGAYGIGNPPPQWPWDANWWKPKNSRRDLVRAAALIVAEIERLDREDKEQAKA